MRRLRWCALSLAALAGCSGAPTPIATRPMEPLLEADAAADDVFAVGAPDPGRVDVAALQALVDDADSYGSDGLLVAVDDTIIVERYFGRPRGVHNVQSVTKSVDALAVGALLDRGRLTSLDELVGDFYADWQSGDKAKVTLRELLTHTSGMHDSDTGVSGNDALAFDRALPLLHAPGTTFDYSNAGVQLLSGIIATAAGMGADELVDRTYFQPMGIRDWQWDKDAAGNVDTPGGLFLTPRELLRLARLLRDDGAWNGQPLVSAAWVQAAGSSQAAAAPCYGLLFWLERDGCSAGRPPYGDTRGYYALGWGGQYVVVIPSANLIAVRTKDPIGESDNEEEATFFTEFPDLVLALAK